ncbi:hypothetical protein HA051_16500 [Chromobacterium vaccinii]|nr:hypothetical protein [Chromobacterium vaccinii]
MIYQYSGPVAGVHLADDVGDRVLIDGQRYELPEADADVQRLASLGFLAACNCDQAIESIEKKGAKRGG